MHTYIHVYDTIHTYIYTLHAHMHTRDAIWPKQKSQSWSYKWSANMIDKRTSEFPKKKRGGSHLVTRGAGSRPGRGASGVLGATTIKSNAASPTTPATNVEVSVDATSKLGGSLLLEDGAGMFVGYEKSPASSACPNTLCVVCAWCM
jgi:hypothetical protein